MNPESPLSPENETVNVKVPTLKNIVGRRPIIPGFWVLAIIFFFCTFFVVKCGELEVASLTGMDLVTGTTVENKTESLTNDEGEPVHPNVWAIISLSAAVVGIIVFLLWKRQDAVVGILASGLGFVSLVILHFDINSGMQKEQYIKLSTEYRIGYWGALIAFLLAGIFSVLRIRYKQKPIRKDSSPPQSFS